MRRQSKTRQRRSPLRTQSQAFAEWQRQQEEAEEQHQPAAPLEHHNDEHEEEEHPTAPTFEVRPDPERH